MANEWKASTVGDFCPFIYGKALPERSRIPGVFPVISSAGISGSHNEPLVTTGGIVIGRKGTVGSVTLSKSAFWPIDTAFYIADEPQRDLRFTYYLLKTLELNRMNSDSAVPGLNRENAHARKIFVPGLKEQRAIAHILGTLDDKIELNRQQNATLEAMARALFKAWFVDFDPVKAKIAARAEGRDPLRAAMSAISGSPDAELDTLPPEAFNQLATTAALFPDEMEESELGDIPRGWSVSKVETLLSRLSAKARYTKEQVSAYGQIPVFEQGASILLGYHNRAASYPASAESPMFIFGDHTCVTRLSCQPFDISQNVIPLQGKNRATAWVYYAVKEKQKFQEYRRHWMELISKDVAVATADTCLEFSQRIMKLHLQIEANERQMQSLQELRDTLLPKLLSGELRVPDTEAFLQKVAP